MPDEVHAQILSNISTMFPDTVQEAPIDTSGDSDEEGSGSLLDDSGDEVEPQVPSQTDVTVETDPATEPAKVEAAPDAEDPFLKEHGEFMKAEGIKLRENRIPYSNVKKIVANAQKKATEAAAAEYTTKTTDFESRIKQYEEELKAGPIATHLMFNDRKTFVQRLLQVNPALSEFIHLDGPPASAGSKSLQPAAEAEPVPEPDYDMGNGVFTYSSNIGIPKLLAWMQKQTKREALAELQSTIEPLAKSHKAAEEERQRKEAHEAWVRAEQPKRLKEIEDAQKNWPGFKDQEEEIFKALNKDPEIRTLRQAYNAVRLQALEAELTKTKAEKDAALPAKAKLQAELLGKHNSKPTSTSVQPGPTPAVSEAEGDDDPVTTQIKANLRRMAARRG